MAIPAVIPVIVKIGATIYTILGRLIGAAPRGDFQKFSRTVYPKMVQKAAESGKPVDAFWFGDIVRVQPDGAYGVSMTPGSLPAAEEYWKTRAGSENFFVIRCVDEEFRQCSFDAMGPTGIFAGIGIGNGAGTGAAKWLIPAGLAALVWKFLL